MMAYELVKQRQIVEDLEQLKVNTLAVKACQGIENLSKDETEYQSYEAQFNASCYLANKGQYQEALRWLESSLTGALKSLTEDGYPEEEREQELVPYYLQRAFILGKLLEPHHEKALRKCLYTAIKYGKGDNRRIARFNLRARKRRITARLVRRLLDSTKLSPTQRIHAMLHWVWQQLKKAGINLYQQHSITDPQIRKKIHSATRVIRLQLLDSPSTRPIAAALLLQALASCQLNQDCKVPQEIVDRALNSLPISALEMAWRSRLYCSSSELENNLEMSAPGTKGIIKSFQMAKSGKQLKSMKRSNKLTSLAKDVQQYTLDGEESNVETIKAGFLQILYNNH